MAPPPPLQSLVLNRLQAIFNQAEAAETMVNRQIAMNNYRQIAMVNSNHVKLVRIAVNYSGCDSAASGTAPRPSLPPSGPQQPIRARARPSFRRCVCVPRLMPASPPHPAHSRSPWPRPQSLVHRVHPGFPAPVAAPAPAPAAGGASSVAVAGVMVVAVTAAVGGGRWAMGRGEQQAHGRGGGEEGTQPDKYISSGGYIQFTGL